MDHLCDAEQCIGCMACYNVCNFHAIDIEKDNLGMFRPIINPNFCKNCGMCTAVCPILVNQPGNFPSSAWALYTKNEQDRKTCSSGGAATTFSRLIIKEGGIVYGTGFDENGMPVIKRASDQNGLEEFKGSKYVYSFPGRSYRQVENDLKLGQKCLFIGTPCQVDGLKHYLRQPYPNLITVDLICHGTPPYTYLDEYTRQLPISHDGAPLRVAFRGTHDYYFTVYGNNDAVLYSRKLEEDPYFLSFMKGLICRQPCYHCKYAADHRVSDLTIGDFWGLGRDALNGYQGKVSVVLTNSEKGEQFFHKSVGEFIAEERTVKEAVEGNAQLRRPALLHKDRERFVKSYISEQDFMAALRNTEIIKDTRKNRFTNMLKYVPRLIKHKFLK